MPEKLSDSREDTACIILNWKNPESTASCLNRVMAAESCPSLIYVIDNHSEDSSQEKIFNILLKSNSKEKLEKIIIWIDTLENIGYAGGNNIALKEIYKTQRIKFIWIINNDLEVEKNTLSAMVNKLNENPKTGFVGTPIIYSGSNEIQCYGGGLHTPYLGINRMKNKGTPLEQVTEIKKLPDYIMGCNILTRREVISDIGYMDEQYFMYSEEIDWQFRAKDKGWKINVTAKTFVAHGTKKNRSARGETYYYYKNRSAILFVKKHHGIIWATIALVANIPIALLDKPNPKYIHKAFSGLINGLTS